jgi:hypothetical protein
MRLEGIVMSDIEVRYSEVKAWVVAETGESPEVVETWARRLARRGPEACADLVRKAGHDLAFAFLGAAETYHAEDYYAGPSRQTSGVGMS